MMPVPATQGLPRRALLRDDVYQAIRDAIVRGELQPGEQLRDAELSAWLGVSRTPIREALLRLSRAGLVTADPGRATRVTAEDPAAIADAQAVAAALQALAMSLAAPRLGPGEIRRMETANEELTAALTAGDAEAAIAADDAFHAVAIEQAANPTLAEHLESVTLMLRRAEFLHFDAMNDASVQQHVRIIAALRGGDAEAAVELTRMNWLTIITA